MSDDGSATSTQRLLICLFIFCFLLTVISILLFSFSLNRLPERSARFHPLPFNGEPLARGNRTIASIVLEQLRFVPSKLRDRPLIIYTPDRELPPSRLGYAPFRSCFPLANKCFLSNKDAHKTTADVVVFTPTSEFTIDYPRPADQIWILQLLESPENTENLAIFDGKVNFTASYRRNSDIVSPYGLWIRDEKALPTANLADYAKGKTKKVAWFVSHCLTKNRRRHYAHSLQPYIQVDIFGECGSKSISRSDGYRMLRDHYKFYLSFENSNCRDYVTEKFFLNALENNVIPIVMGPSKDFYDSIAPPHSFIHVDQFASPRDLAKYLHYLDRNATAYNEFFRWQSMGQFVDTKFWCRICAMMQVPPRKVYERLDRWWHSSRDCKL